MATEVKTAWLSLDRRYRYQLVRTWGAGPRCTFVMLNPSTADAAEDDPTIRRCRNFAKREGLSGMMVINLFALRSPNPKELLAANDPWGIDNSAAISNAFTSSMEHGAPVIAAWGVGVRSSVFEHTRDAVVHLAQLHNVRMHCLGVTKNGSPRHPLYVPSDSPLIPWPPQRD